MISNYSLSLVHNFNTFFAPFLDLYTWNILEFFLGLFTFIICLLQRVYIPSYKSNDKEDGFIITKVGQFGLYIHMFMALFLMADGFINQLSPHVLLMFFVLGLLCTKAKTIDSIYYLLKN